MGSWGREDWEWKLVWSRNLRGREVSCANDLMQFINRVKLKQLEEDRWRWSLSTDGIYSTKKAYRKLMENAVGSDDDDKNQAYELLWRSATTRRTQAIVWKVLRQRMPTREDLRRRGIIQGNGDTTCVLCGEEEENLNHLFFECKFANNIWWNIYHWTGISTAPQRNPIEHFLQHSATLGSNDVCLGSTIWIGTIWYIWKCRNERVFEGTVPSLGKITDEIKARTWSWIVAKRKGASLIPYVQWRRKPVAL
ncbi:hypothetical protein ACS0TY_036799 [Phlomoides rotata]